MSCFHDFTLIASVSYATEVKNAGDEAIEKAGDITTSFLSWCHHHFVSEFFSKKIVHFYSAMVIGIGGGAIFLPAIIFFFTF